MESTNSDNISAVIKRVRKEQKLTQGKFADKLDVNIKTVQNWEYNYTSPSRSNIQTVIDKFSLKEEDYPELFEYISHPRDAGAENATADSDGAVKQPLVSGFNSPLKVIILAVLAAVVAFGVFFAVYKILENFIGYYTAVRIIISVVCALAVITVILLVYFLIIARRKK